MTLFSRAGVGFLVAAIIVMLVAQWIDDQKMSALARTFAIMLTIGYILSVFVVVVVTVIAVTL